MTNTTIGLTVFSLLDPNFGPRLRYHIAILAILKIWREDFKG